MGTEKPAWLSDESLSLTQKIGRLRKEYPHIIQELRREFLENHKGPQERVRAKIRGMAGL